ncbi:hypothetical protein [Sphingobacterium multivorum]|uniref:hypothetical protein n=1 Tax=Sphingobacterium multivorum TaxID=28454 RepID=UPI003019795F
MIKIQIKDIQKFKDDYLSVIKDQVLHDLELLKLSISHLLDPNLIKKNDINSVSTLTKDIVNIIRTPKLVRSFFNKPVYLNAVKTYSDNAAIKKTNWQSLISFINVLLDWKNDWLKTLLVGRPEVIKKFNDKLITNYKFKIHEVEILKYGFKYNGEVGKKIRNFFYETSLTTYCPYCNLELALNSKNPTTGATANQLNLDHFFDKDNNPLLSLSLFNLIPCDTTCNTTNKYTTEFSDEYHLNPYLSGFKRDMVFEPLFMKNTVYKINLKINVLRTSKRYFQLIGDADDINEKPMQGNLNVFQISTKYNQEYIYEELNWLSRQFLKAIQGFSSIDEFLKSMGEKNTESSFINWYESTAKSKFHEKEFGKHAKSKLNRDFFDLIMRNHHRPENKLYINLLEKSYDPSLGGE